LSLREEVTEKSRKLRDEELTSLTNHCSGVQIKNDVGGACSTCGGEENFIRDFGGET
jgi:hypothetical protein